MMKIKEKAFTLVELLIVIGVIALLVSILIPACNNSKSNFNNRNFPETKIGSNVYQIEVSYVSSWSNAVKQFTTEHPDLKVISITKPSESDWRKYVIITVGNPE